MASEPAEAWSARRPSPPASETPAAPFDGFLVPVALYLLIVLCVGGSSADYLRAGSLQLLAIPVLGLAVVRLARRAADDAIGWPIALCAAAVSLPLLQLAPLPPHLWSQLPAGRLLLDGYAAAGVAPTARPLTLTPDETWGALFAVLPPISVFTGVLTLSDRDRSRLAAVVLAVALGSILLAMFQRVGPEVRVLGMIDLSSANGASGLFANRNHQGLLLAACLPLVALVALGADRPRPGQGLRVLVAFSLAFLLVVGALVTTSRAALGLTGLGALFALGIAASQTGGAQAAVRRARLAAVGCAVAIGAGLVFALASGPIASRFQASGPPELRLTLFPTVAAAGLDFAPFGSGLGSFASVYQIYENPKALGPSFVNHAHNEYLEIWLEAGLPGVLILAGFVAWWGWATVKALRAEPGRRRETALTGASIVALFLLHSLVDYPARAPGLAVLAGLACALLVKPGSGGSPASDAAPASQFARVSRGATAILIWPLLLGIGWVCLTHLMSVRDAVRDPARSLRWNPENAHTLSADAEAAFGRSARDPADRIRAASLARQTLRLAPLDARAYRVLALVAEADGDPDRARRLMAAGSLRSRRDELTMVWLFLDDLRARRFVAAMSDADIALRQRPDLEEVIFPALEEELGDPAARAAVVGALAQGPQWRDSFFRILANTSHDPDLARRVYADLRTAGGKPSDKEVGYLVARLVAMGAYGAARDEWANGVPSRGVVHGVYDGGFEGLSGEPPFNWRYISPDGGADSASAEPIRLDEGGVALRVQAPANGTRTLAEQVLLLPPGSYRIAVEARGGAGDEDSGARFSWRITCLPLDGPSTGELQVAGLTGGWRVQVTPFRIDPTCPAQMLRLQGRGDASGAGHADFRALRIEPANGTTP